MARYNFGALAFKIKENKIILITTQDIFIEDFKKFLKVISKNIKTAERLVKLNRDKGACIVLCELFGDDPQECPYTDCGLLILMEHYSHNQETFKGVLKTVKNFGDDIEVVVS